MKDQETVCCCYLVGTKSVLGKWLNQNILDKNIVQFFSLKTIFFSNQCFSPKTSILEMLIALAVNIVMGLLIAHPLPITVFTFNFWLEYLTIDLYLLPRQPQWPRRWWGWQRVSWRRGKNCWLSGIPPFLTKDNPSASARGVGRSNHVYLLILGLLSCFQLVLNALFPK